jgi:hypothetical protein
VLLEVLEAEARSAGGVDLDRAGGAERAGLAVGGRGRCNGRRRGLALRRK